MLQLSMQNIHYIISRLSSLSTGTTSVRFLKQRGIPTFKADTRIASGNRIGAYQSTGVRVFSANSGWDGSGRDEGPNDWDGTGGRSLSGTGSSDLDWGSVSSWSTGITKDHFDGEIVGRKTSSTDSGRGTSQAAFIHELQEFDDRLNELEAENKKGSAFVNGWDQRHAEISVLLKQVREPGARGSYLKDSEKAEIYRLHKENPEVYTVDRLAKDYRIMRQRVHAILWLKELQEEEEKKLGHPLDDSVELLLDTFPEFFNSHDREFHVASLPYKPDFKVMPEDWDGTTRDPDEVHYEISKKEDDMLYEEFVQRMNFNKMKVSPVFSV
uniref:Keratin type I cytoskeletal 10 n=1 Tax=Rhizophora mucronata TaxID=61149 RepID=A0A2P2IRE0_RHIMU